MTTCLSSTLTRDKLDALPTPLARQRALSCLTIREVCTALGTSYGMMSQYENGQKTPSRQLQQRIADFYEVEIDYLFGSEDREYA